MIGGTVQDPPVDSMADIKGGPTRWDLASLKIQQIVNEPWDELLDEFWVVCYINHEVMRNAS